MSLHIRKLKLYICVLLSLGIFTALGTYTYANSDVIDQQNNEVSSYGNQIYTNGHRQTFTPSFSQITKVQVYLTERIEGENLIIILRKENTSQVVKSQVKRMSENGEGWEIFSFESLFVTPKEVYSIELQTNHYGVDTPIWMKSEGDVYQNGNHVLDGEVFDDDMVFVTWGYSDDGESSMSELPTTGEGEDSDESYENFTTKKNYWEAEVTDIDDNMILPEILYVKYNDSVVDIEAGNSVNVYASDTLEVIGNASAAINIVLYIEQEAFITKADDGGNWTLLIECSQMRVGEYNSKIQAQNNGVGSSIVDAFSIKRLEGDNPQKSILDLKDTILYPLFLGKYKIYTYSVLFFVVFLSSLILIIRNRKKKKPLQVKEINHEKDLKKKREEDEKIKEKEKIDEKKKEVVVDEKIERQKAIVEAMNEQLRDFGKPVEYDNDKDEINNQTSSNNKEESKDIELEKFKNDIDQIKKMGSSKSQK